MAPNQIDHEVVAAFRAACLEDAALVEAAAWASAGVAARIGSLALGSGGRRLSGIVSMMSKHFLLTVAAIAWRSRAYRAVCALLAQPKEQRAGPLGSGDEPGRGSSMILEQEQRNALRHEPPHPRWKSQTALED